MLDHRLGAAGVDRVGRARGRRGSAAAARPAARRRPAAACARRPARPSAGRRSRRPGGPAARSSARPARGAVGAVAARPRPAPGRGRARARRRPAPRPRRRDERGAAAGRTPTAASRALAPRWSRTSACELGRRRQRRRRSGRRVTPRRGATVFVAAVLRGAVAALEALDAAAGVHQLLLAGVEGVALAAELDVQLAALGRAGGEGVAARAAAPWRRRTSGWMSAFMVDLRGSYRGRCSATGSGRRPATPDGCLAISARNSSLVLNVFSRSISSSRPGAALPSAARPESTRRSFHTCWSCLRSNSSSSWRVEEASTSMAG